MKKVFKIITVAVLFIVSLSLFKRAAAFLGKSRKYGTAKQA